MKPLRVNPLRTALAVALSLMVVAACRPPIGGSAEPSATSIAGSLAPTKEMSVAIHLPGAPDALSAPVAYAAASESIAGSGVFLESVVPYADEDAFDVRISAGQVDLFIATPAAALLAREAGHDLVMIAGLQRTAPMLLATAPTGPSGIGVLSGSSILVQGRPGDEAPILAALAAAGVDTAGVLVSHPEDPSAPFDPTGLFDETYAAVAVNSYDGAARLQEFYSLETGLPLGPDGTTAIPDESGTLSAAAGVGVWVLRSALDDPDSVTALALTLIAIADGLAHCRDDAAACAVVLEDGGEVDRYGDALLWSINALNATMWPAPEGALAIDTAALSAAADQALSVGLITTPPVVDAVVDQRVLDLALSHLPSTIDLEGASWTPIEVQLPLE